jgi:hypothetical protein
MQRVHLDISIGEHAVDYAQIAAKEKLDELQLRVRQLLDQVEQITKEQAYQRVSNQLRYLDVHYNRAAFVFSGKGGAVQASER